MENIILPEDFVVKDGVIVRQWHDKQGSHEEEATNGTFMAISHKQYADTPDDWLLVVRFISKDGSRYEDVPIPVRELTGSGNKLLDYVPPWFALLGQSPSKRLHLLQNALNQQRKDFHDFVKILRVGPGYHSTEDGTLYYCLGNRVINRPVGINLELTSTFHLRHTDGSLGQGIPWVRRFCEQGPPQAALFVATLTAYVRPVLESRGINQRLAAYICGESGTGKSESAKLLCSYFREQSGATLSSDKADIFRMMAECRDTTFLVDDLNDSGVVSVSAKKTERLSEVIQQVSGNGTLSIRGEEFDVGLATPIITAEKLLPSYSTVNRTLIVQFDRPFDPETMSWLQEKHNLFVDFLEGFIGWICQNHARLELYVQSWSFSNLHGGVQHPEAYVGFNRLVRTFEILKVTLEVFLLHLHEVYAIPQEVEQSWRRLLEEGINQAAFSDTLKHLRKDSPEQERFYVDAVLDIFWNEDQRSGKYERLVAKSFSKYKELNKLAKENARIPHKIFFRHDDDFYCFRGDDLVRYLMEQNASYRVSKSAISAQLDFHGLLQRQGGELSYPISEDGKKRYYHLRVNAVERMLKERREAFWADMDDEDKLWVIPRR
ncbi:hypothetical protein AALA82_16580 [Oscillospiraceae bacterium 50-16]